jgi:hypothetical protein
MLAAVGFIHAQQPPSRSVIPPDFGKYRPAGSGKKTTTGPYDLSAQEPRLPRRKPQKAKTPNPPPGMVATTGPAQLVGVTLWKLRPAKPGDSASLKISVRGTDGKRETRTPVRATFADGLALNDLIRLTVEAEREGYLYVVDSELRRDGTLGAPYLIFPDAPGVDNSIKPGMVVDFPDRTEDLPYFRLSSDDPNYAGEILTVIISPKPLREWDLKREGLIGNLDWLAELEQDAGEVTRFERRAGVGTPETDDEKAATAGNRTRSLGGTLDRRLTRDKPLPQTVFETRPDPRDLIVFPVRLSVSGRQ